MNHKKTKLMYAVSHGQSEVDPGQAGAVSTDETSLTLTGLHPYEEYTISVQAGNKGGLSVPVTGTARTYSDSELCSSKDKYLPFQNNELNSDIQGVLCTLISQSVLYV